MLNPQNTRHYLPLQKVFEGELGKLPGIAGHHAEAEDGKNSVEQVQKGEVVEHEDLISINNPG